MFQFYISKFDLLQKARVQRTMYQIKSANIRVVHSKLIEFDKFEIASLRAFKTILIKQKYARLYSQNIDQLLSQDEKNLLAKMRSNFKKVAAMRANQKQRLSKKKEIRSLMKMNTNKVQINDIMEEIKEADPEEERTPRGEKTPKTPKRVNFIDEFNTHIRRQRMQIKSKAGKELEQHPILGNYDKSQVISKKQHLSTQIDSLEFLSKLEDLPQEEKDKIRE